MNDDAVRDIKRALSDPMRVCEQLGLLAGKGSFTRQGGGVLIRCPVHADNTPSCSVQVKGGVLLWKCHACDQAGDALTLIAAVHGLSMAGDDFRQVLIAGAELGGLHSLVADLDRDGLVERPKMIERPAPKAEQERDYPPLYEVEALWSSTGQLGEGERAWATARGIDADLISDLARCLPVDGDLPRWASYQGKSWRETGHRVVVPVFDTAGAMRSVRAIRVTDGDSPKRLPPGGHKAAGLVMACEFGQGMLRGSYVPTRLLVLEGEPDFLSSLAYPWPEVYARIGITSGSWTVEFAARIPAGTTVILGTHNDAPGEKYAKAIAETLPSHKLRRWRRVGAAA